MRDITAEEIQTYREDGIVCLRGMFDGDWVARMREAAEVSLAHPTEMAIEMADTQSVPGRFFFDTFVWRSNPLCREFVFHSPAAALMARVMQTERLNIFFDQWLIKEPGTEVPTPWHHDLPYWPVDGDQLATIWLALDEVDLSNGAVEYIKGSHRWGQRYLPQSFGGTVEFSEDLPELPDIEAARGDYDIVHFDLEPGDCTIHHALLVHGARGNSRANTRRRAYVTRWAGADATFRPGPHVRHMPELPDILAGGPLDSELWPVVWQA